MSPNNNAHDLVERVMSIPIERVIREYPEALPVLYNHFGASCFDCPGRHEECLERGILLHEADREIVFEDLERVLNQKIGKGEMPGNAQSGKIAKQ